MLRSQAHGSILLSPAGYSSMLALTLTVCEFAKTDAAKHKTGSGRSSWIQKTTTPFWNRLLPRIRHPKTIHTSRSLQRCPVSISSMVDMSSPRVHDALCACPTNSLWPAYTQGLGLNIARWERGAFSYTFIPTQCSLSQYEQCSEFPNKVEYSHR